MNGVWIVIKGRCLETFAIKAFNDGCKWNPLKSGSLGGKNIPLRVVHSIMIPAQPEFQIFRRIGTCVTRDREIIAARMTAKKSLQSSLPNDDRTSEWTERTNERPQILKERQSVTRLLTQSALRSLWWSGDVRLFWVKITLRNEIFIRNRVLISVV